MSNINSPVKILAVSTTSSSQSRPLPTPTKELSDWLIKKPASFDLTPHQTDVVRNHIASSILSNYESPQQQIWAWRKFFGIDASTFSETFGSNYLNYEQAKAKEKNSDFIEWFASALLDFDRQSNQKAYSLLREIQRYESIDAPFDFGLLSAYYPQWDVEARGHPLPKSIRATILPDWRVEFSEKRTVDSIVSTAITSNDPSFEYNPERTEFDIPRGATREEQAFEERVIGMVISGSISRPIALLKQEIAKLQPIETNERAQNLQTLLETLEAYETKNPTERKTWR